MAAPARARPELEFGAEFLRKLEVLNVIARKIFAGALRADRQSVRKGVSAEFADHRSYVPGDDFRHVDWHLFGRLEELFLKLYKEEENLHLTLLLDSSLSMDQGARNKLNYALQVAAALAYIGMSNMDCVHLLPFDRRLRDNGLWGLKGRGQVFRLFDYLARLEPAQHTDLARSCREFIGKTRQRGIVVVLSDFYDLDGFQPGLRYLKFPRHSVYVLHVVDELEERPDIRGDLRLVDCEAGTHREINVTEGLLARYEDAFGRLARGVESFCVRNEMGYCLARTAVPFDELVLKILRRGGLVG
ncbi:MAG: DUF58 domain-containing protein [Planctomycetota bacterium]|nr:MAG: DUF58 domain-containing protein [Planctomycetota bacterium]